MQRRQFLTAATAAGGLQTRRTFNDIPKDYLAEPDRIPSFWLSSCKEVDGFLDSRIIQTGKVTEFGKSAGGLSLRMVSYGTARKGAGTTTFSGSLGFGDVKAYIGPDHQRKVYLAMASVHGGEFEGIVGMVNLLHVLETGKDLRGKAWPEIRDAAAALDRIILIPILNKDGRNRVPLRMIRHRGTDFTVHEYFNTGAKPDGSIIGWPQCKQNIPLDFAKTQFPGGYPNDAGVNVQHDDFFGNPQPETRALFRLTAQERPDLTMNMHTGANYIHPLRSFIEPVLTPRFEELYRRLLTRLTNEGLQQTRNVETHADPRRERPGVFNLDSAINMHCGALAVLVESPSHNHSQAKRNGEPYFHTPEQLLDAQLLCHLEAMKYLGETGGRARWTAKP
jgi:hypothetical protein